MKRARHVKRMPLCVGRRKGRVLRLVILAEGHEKGPRATGVTTEATARRPSRKVAEDVSWIN